MSAWTWTRCGSEWIASKEGVDYYIHLDQSDHRPTEYYWALSTDITDGGLVEATTPEEAQRLAIEDYARRLREQIGGLQKRLGEVEA